ncbi:MAG: hypothetical protein K1X55_17500 [Chitinophagales bacterium]|nr:hypothetical protein [Chitinophagales bacterium]
MTLGQLIQALAEKAGIDKITDQNLINVLSNAELSKISVHSDLVKALNENLLSVDAAADNHPLIGAKYKAQALNALDKKLETIIDGLPIEDDVKVELKANKNSYARLDSVFEKLKDVKPAQAKGDDSALKAQVDTLLAKLTAKEQEFATLKAESDGKIESIKKTAKLTALLGGFKTIYDELDPEIKETSLLTIIEKELAKNDAKFSFDEQGNFTIIKNDGSAFVNASHSKYNPSSFIEQVLTDTKTRVVAPVPGPTPGQQPIIPGTPPQVDGTNQAVADFNSAQLI